MNIYHELEDKRGEAEALLGLGEVFSGLKEYRQAIDYLQRTIKIVQDLDDREGERRACSALGASYFGIQKYEKAIEFQEKSLKIAQEMGTSNREELAYLCLGGAFLKNGKHDKAIECYEKSLRIAEEQNLNDTQEIALETLAGICQDTGKFQKAIDYSEKLLKIAEESGINEKRGHAYLILGTSCNNFELYEKAEEYLQKALTIAIELKNENEKADVYDALGSLYDDLNKYDLAMENFDSALEILKKLGEKEKAAGCLGNLAAIYNGLGQYDKAISCNKKRLQMSEKTGDKIAAVVSYCGLGKAYDDTGQYENAIECYQKQLEIAKECGVKNMESNAISGLGNVFESLGRNEMAVIYYQEHLKISQELNEIGSVGDAHRSLARIFCRTGQLREAIVSYQASLKINSKQKDQRAQAICFHGLGWCYLKLLQFKKASELFCKAILCIESVRNSVINQDEFNTSLSDKFADCHKSLTTSLLCLQQARAALLVSDVGKAKALQDLMRKRTNVSLEPTDHFTTWIETIAKDPSSSLCEKLLDQATSNVINSIQDGSVLLYAFDHAETLHIWILSEKKVYHRTWKATNGMSSLFYLQTCQEELRRCLNDRSTTTVLEHANDEAMQNENTKMKPKILIEKEQRTSFATALEQRLQNIKVASESLMESYRHCVSEDKVAHSQRLKNCYNLDCNGNQQTDDIKIKRIRSEDATKTFQKYGLDTTIFSTSEKISRTGMKSNNLSQYTNFNGYLSKLYSILIAPVQDHLTGTKLVFVPEGPLFTLPISALMNSKKQHLCDSYSIQVTPALHTLNTSLKLPLSKHGPALFVGNPRVGTVRFGRQNVTPEPLPNAAIEAEECARYFESKPLTEQHATKENVLRDMKDASIIHIAAHGHMEYADIFLAPNADASNPAREKDYLLQAKDVTGTILSARLVVLSCCHSGSGQVSPEGVVGIARSFLGAGARSVLVALWEISDEKTLEFMKCFYDNLCTGQSVCVALQRTMKSVKEQQSIGDWAPFEIFGEDVAFSKYDIEEIRRQSSKR